MRLQTERNKEMQTEKQIQLIGTVTGQECKQKGQKSGYNYKKNKVTLKQ